jgi:hypothetical protein
MSLLPTQSVITKDRKTLMNKDERDLQRDQQEPNKYYLQLSISLSSKECFEI